MSQLDSYTIDSIALLGYLADKLPSRPDRIFRMAEDDKALLVVPSITLGESIFTLLKGKEVFGTKVSPEKIILFLEILSTSRSLRLYDLTVEGWRDLMSINLPELHDRMIVAAHKESGSRAIVTNDEEISKLEGIRAIW